ncbi:MAG: hypothetical protein DRH49_08055 [Candidatus Coatesbacteria bacterium]|nr:MAG: hypothetical protein DRH49_08055 [Candidatus Coatesbacteria bacterium]
MITVRTLKVLISILVIFATGALPNINWDPNIYLTHNFDYLYTFDRTDYYPQEKLINANINLAVIHTIKLEEGANHYNILTLPVEIGMPLTHSFYISGILPIIYDDIIKDIFPYQGYSSLGLTSPWLKFKLLFGLGNNFSGGLRCGFRIPIGTERYKIYPIAYDICYLTHIGYDLPAQTSIQFGLRYESKYKNIQAPSFLYVIIREVIPTGQRFKPFGCFGLTYPINRFKSGIDEMEALKDIWLGGGFYFVVTENTLLQSQFNYRLSEEGFNQGNNILLVFGISTYVYF